MKVPLWLPVRGGAGKNSRKKVYVQAALDIQPTYDYMKLHAQYLCSL